jgi:Cu/Zn superoxide dismutase
MSRLVAFAVVALTAAACGWSGTSSATSPSPSPVAATPTPTPTPTPAGLAFKMNGIDTTASGTVTVTTQPGSVTVEESITGLLPNSSHVSHVHLGSCDQRGGILYSLNQVVADGQGMADTKTTIDQTTYPPASGTWYVVIHAGPDMQGSNATYLLCGNLFT